MTARALVAILLLTLSTWSTAVAAPEGQLTTAVHVSMAPTWFDPAETVGIITPFMFLYAMHDALVKSDAGQRHGPEPGRVVDRLAGQSRVRVRPAAKARNSTTVIRSRPEDVKFSYERYRGAGAGPFKARIAAIDDRSTPSASASASSSPGPTS